jgi:hypothetical protein
MDDDTQESYMVPISVEDMTDEDKAFAIKRVIEILEIDFNNGNCGKHDSITLSCTGCQAAIVRSWLVDTSDWCYGTEIAWKKN